MKNENNDFISVEEKLPNNFQKVLIKTDCNTCPLAFMIFVNGKFITDTIVQCDHHYETDEKFEGLIKINIDRSILENYIARITHWMPYPEIGIIL